MMKTGKFKIVSLVLLLVVVVAGGLSAQEHNLGKQIKEKEKELTKMREEIIRQRKNIEALKAKEKDIGNYLVRLKRERSLTKTLLEGIEEKGNMLEKQVGILKESLGRNEEIYTQRLKIFSGRLREIYKEGNRYFWQEFLNAEDFSDLVQRYKFFVMVSERDALLIDDIKIKRDEISREEDELTRMLHEVFVSGEEKRVELAQLGKNEEERTSAMAQLKNREKRYQKKIDKLASAQENLLNIIIDLEERRKKAIKMRGSFGEPDFPHLKGKMQTPVSGSTVRRFGRSRHPQFGTVTFNSGIDISAREGSPIRGVARGRIEYAGELSGYGNCIILNHGDGYYTLYARTGRILVKQGDQVEEGDIIAEVLSSLVSNEGIFHFEIRKSKKALNPEEWIK
ncbi:peptidoglycan DD-metalloendopeptidase family protein [bacterium]|nr:peptidoglycan DD-metalloendopeptidase family protein [bacterium]